MSSSVCDSAYFFRNVYSMQLTFCIVRRTCEAMFSFSSSMSRSVSIYRAKISVESFIFLLRSSDSASFWEHLEKPVLLRL